jgi:hypothetical protein
LLLRGVLRHRIRPCVIAGFAQPGIGGLYGLERRVRRAALWADRQFVRRRCFQFLLLVKDVLRNGLGSDELSLIELVGSDQNAGAAPSRAAGCLNPGVDPRTLKHRRDVAHLDGGFAVTEGDLPCVMVRSVVLIGL